VWCALKTFESIGHLQHHSFLISNTWFRSDLVPSPGLNVERVDDVELVCVDGRAAAENINLVLVKGELVAISERKLALVFLSIHLCPGPNLVLTILY